MTWATRFRIRQFLRQSLWVAPAVGAAVGLLGAWVAVAIGHQVAVPPASAYSPSTASAVLSAVAGAVAALAGFVVTVTVLVVQMATGTFSARCMRLWYHDPVLKGVLALLIGTLAFALSLLSRIEDAFVPDRGVTLAGVLLIGGLVMFVLFLNRFVHRLRPVAVAGLLARELREGLDGSLARVRDVEDVFAAPLEAMDELPTLVVRCASPGAVQAFSLARLAAWARRHQCLVVMRPAVGAFVQAGDALFDVYGDPGAANEAAATLHGMVALGLERTIEQDAAFGLRVMVDVASRALSPGINDPTTAVQVLDYLGDSLRVIGTAELTLPSWHAGAARRGVVVPMRRWEDFLALGVTEIRQYGGTSIQVVRRLRDVLETLLREVRPEHRAAVDAEIARLDATVAAAFAGSVDRTWAGIADGQGLGGSGCLQLAEPAARRQPASIPASGRGT